MAKLIKTKVELEGRTTERNSVTEGPDLPAWTAETELKYAGQPQPRIDGEERVTGRAKYTCDVQLPGMLYAMVLRSPYPHARVKHIDTQIALKFPGVRGIISRFDSGRILWDGEPVFSEIVGFSGDEVAALAADDYYISEDALRLINVEYEVLPFVTKPDASILPGAKAIKAEFNLVGDPRIYSRGEIDKGFDEADLVLENAYDTQSAFHNCLETHGAIAAWNGDELTVWESTQSINRVREDLAAVFGLPLHKVRVICEYMGGGFGSKQSTGKWAVMAALLARRSNRPVQLMLSRSEDNLASGHRAPTVQRLRMGLKNDGTLTALELEATVNVGAYESNARAVEGPCQVMYACPNVRTEVRSAMTNTGFQRSFRGPGYVEGAFALESLLDEAAEKLGLDPLDIRLKNYARIEQSTGQGFSSKQLDKCYRMGAEMIGWPGDNKPSEIDTHILRGYGMASQVWGGGGGPPAFAWVRINEDATVEVITGSQDIGTGTRTVFAQIAAEELKVSPDRIIVRIGDTEVGPYAPVSWGSMTVSSVGPAVRQAARDAREQLFQIIGELLGVPGNNVKMENELVFVGEESRPRLNLEELSRQVGRFTILGKGARGPNAAGIAVRTFGAQFAEVEVNTATGEVKVCRLISVHDIGRIINPLGASSQVYGAVIQGFGYALMEERVIDSTSGKVLNANMEDYMLPTVLDFNDIESGFVDEPDITANIIGAKGLGEQAMIPTAPAIINAIASATGIRILSLPVTRNKILTALEDKVKAGDKP